MKALNVVVVFIDSAGVRANNVSKRYASTLFDNADSNYAEVFVQCCDVAFTCLISFDADKDFDSKCTLFDCQISMEPSIPFCGCPSRGVCRQPRSA
jgi:hypothetical protein